MKMKQLTAIALMLGLPLAGAFAQQDGTPPGPPDGMPPQDGPPMRMHRMPPPIIAALDTNHDGIIDADEIANASAALRTLDKNGTGKLTLMDLMGPPPRRMGGGMGGGMGPGPDGGQGQGMGPQGMPPGPPPDGMNGTNGMAGHPMGRGMRRIPPVFAALDTNHDGVIDADEIANAPAALKTLDKNGTGQLTIEELLGPRPRGMGMGRGPGGPGGPGPDGGQGPGMGQDGPPPGGGPDGGQPPPPPPDGQN
jgi:EF hand